VIINFIQRSRVRIGIEAPTNIAIDREEIYLRKQQERRSPAFAVEQSREEEIEPMLAPGTLGRLAQRFRTRAGTYTADARRTPSEHEAVIRLTAMASTLEWAASEIQELEGKFRQPGNRTD
jgi:carbon storage regulator CsrA